MLCGRVAEHERLSANQSCRIDVAAEGEFVGAKAARASLEIFGLNLVGRLLPGAGYEDAYCGICARLLDAAQIPFCRIQIRCAILRKVLPNGAGLFGGRRFDPAICREPSAR
jgi:hypothetical protein